MATPYDLLRRRFLRTFHEKPRVRFWTFPDVVVCVARCVMGQKAYVVRGYGPSTDAAWADAVANWRRERP